MSTFRRLHKREAKGGRKSWRAEVFDVGKQKFRWITLFPKNDPRARDPEQADDKLQPAWIRIQDDKVPTQRMATLRAGEVFEELKRKAGLVDSKITTVRELVELEVNHTGKRKRRAISTMNEVRRTLRRFADFMEERFPDIRVQVVKAAHIHDYLRMRRDEGAADGTQRRELAYIRRCFELGFEREILNANPCRRVVLSQPSFQERKESAAECSLSEDEVAALLVACREPYEVTATMKRDGETKTIEWEEDPPTYLHAYTLAAIHTGCRLGELLRSRVKDRATGERHYRDGLRWRDVDWDSHMLHVTGKTGPRKVSMTEEVETALRALQRNQFGSEALAGSDGHVFLSDSGAPVENPTKALRAAVKRAVIKRHVRVHDLRHTCCTLLSQKGVEPELIRRLAGHSDLTVTSVYIHSDDERMTDVVRGAFKGRGSRRQEVGS